MEHIKFISEMLKCFQVMKWNMSVKLHFLDPYQDIFPKNLGECGDEHGGIFHHGETVRGKM
jgi:hypothetical protein